ncbi:HAD family hydrolase [Campylobacter cuniculorum]|uniref:phosphoglycolate phosphatase n=2 Tax=Campylobacter cuniculorum TaxID=374106 RepID=A0A1W6BUH0_9BACT|nr:HAD family hydrolase [Campylobacter cuniculorum]ARJ55736.1 HAD-superfamily hydrolase, subfamily IA, probable phosphoglycolate phosphatase [Campylobacter cuniculorum DSM 23162 = LMG 24588]QOR04957.1 HAD family hydrolase [Campylobacter cuniculorum]
MKKTLLFDLDGTLVDSTTAILDSCKSAFKILGLKPALDNDIKKLIGFTLDEIFIKLYKDKEELAGDFIEEYRKKYHQIYLEQTHLLPQVKEALELANGFADLAVVTTKHSCFTKPLLEFLKINHFFKALVCYDDVRFAKPHPESIFKALSILNKDRKNAFMIGDTKLDILAAKAAEISYIALNCGYESKESLKNYSELIKQNAYEAVCYIKYL